MLLKHVKSSWMWSSRSLSQQPEPVVVPSARPKQRQRASLSACQDLGVNDFYQSTPDRLDRFMHSSANRHLNNNEASLFCCFALNSEHSTEGRRLLLAC